MTSLSQAEADPGAEAIKPARHAALPRVSYECVGSEAAAPPPAATRGGQIMGQQQRCRGRTNGSMGWADSSCHRKEITCCTHQQDAAASTQ